METRRVLRYYCEFCGKSGRGKHAMELHEEHCTMNPKEWETAQEYKEWEAAQKQKLKPSEKDKGGPFPSDYK